MINQIRFTIFFCTFNLFFPISLPLPGLLPILLRLYDGGQGVRSRNGEVLLRGNAREVSKGY